jgi:hypothetical protein
MAAPEAEVYGVPGLGRIGRCGVGAGGDIVFVKHNDGSGNQARQALTKAVDGLILGQGEN